MLGLSENSPDGRREHKELPPRASNSFVSRPVKPHQRLLERGHLCVNNETDETAETQMAEKKQRILHTKMCICSEVENVIQTHRKKNAREKQKKRTTFHAHR